MILKKVALPLAVDEKTYWEAMILAITNSKQQVLLTEGKPYARAV